MNKINQKQQYNYDEEINLLIIKINQMEKRYIVMEKYYTQKITTLFNNIYDQDHLFIKLILQAKEIKRDAESHRSRAEQLKKKQRKVEKVQPKAKSNSPLNSGKSNKKKLSNNQIKSCSPKNSIKKVLQIQLQSTCPKLPKNIKIVCPNYQLKKISNKNIIANQPLLNKIPSIKYLHQFQQQAIKNNHHQHKNKINQPSNNKNNPNKNDYVSPFK